MNSVNPETYKSGLAKNDFITVLYNRYGKKLYSYAIHTWKMDEDVAWDLIYKTLYKVIDSYQNYQFENEDKFASFIFKVFINYLRNHYRDTKKAAEGMEMASVDGAEMQNISKPESIESPKMAALNAELEKMEDWQRMLLLMRSEGRAYVDIAKYIDKPEGQLKVYYQRLKEQITRRLNEQ